jgi:hypothetical protein
MDTASFEIITRQSGLSLLLIGLFAACGGTSQDVPQEASALVTAGGCACPTNPGYPSPEPDGLISLDCFCAEFPGACLSYEKAKTSGRCFDDSRWWLMEKKGCGRLVITTGWGLGGNTLIYDEATHELVGAQASNDVDFGACGVHSYSAGVMDTCNEGTVCSLCDASGASCAPACSMQVLKSNGFGAPVYDMSKGSLYDCQGVEPGYRLPERHEGCGRIAVVTNFGTTSFTSDTHEPLFASFPGVVECEGKWGDPAQPCADETVCSLCEGDPNVCSF